MWLRMLSFLSLCCFFSLPLLLTFFLSLEFM
uniref:CDKC2 n=1 Tax=Arundo donax TaxID=35708 RepID=A0A0A9ECL3_ARUDO